MKKSNLLKSNVIRVINILYRVVFSSVNFYITKNQTYICHDCVFYCEECDKYYNTTTKDKRTCDNCNECMSVCDNCSIQCDCGKVYMSSFFNDLSYVNQHNCLPCKPCCLHELNKYIINDILNIIIKYCLQSILEVENTMKPGIYHMKNQ